MFKSEEEDKIDRAIEGKSNSDYVEEVSHWKDASVVSTIPRLNWKQILGTPLNKYIKDIKDDNYTKEKIIEEVMKKVYEKDKQDDTYFRNWTISKIKQNIEIRISSCKSEMQLYEMNNNIDEGEEKNEL